MKELAWLQLLAFAFSGCAMPARQEPRFAAGFALGAAAWPALGGLELRRDPEVAPGAAARATEALRGRTFDDVGLGGEISIRACPLAVEAGSMPVRLWVGTAFDFWTQGGPQSLEMTDHVTGRTIRGSVSLDTTCLALPGVEASIALHERFECFAGGGLGYYHTKFLETWKDDFADDTGLEDDAWGGFASFGLEVPLYLDEKRRGVSLRLETKAHFVRFGDLERKLGGELDGPVWTFNLGVALRL